jgi:hypothetical protein
MKPLPSFTQFYHASLSSSFSHFLSRLLSVISSLSLFCGAKTESFLSSLFSQSGCINTRTRELLSLFPLDFSSSSSLLVVLLHWVSSLISLYLSVFCRKEEGLFFLLLFIYIYIYMHLSLSLSVSLFDRVVQRKRILKWVSLNSHSLYSLYHSLSATPKKKRKR